jgi:arsenite-transporting ATPase
MAQRRTQEERHLASLTGMLPGMPMDTLPLLSGDLVGRPAIQRLADRLR